MKKYQITCTEEQLHLIQQCVEDCHRFACGQMDMFNTTSCLEFYNEVEERLEKIKSWVTPELHINSYYRWDGKGCPHDYQRKFIAKTYPIYREILHFFSIKEGHLSVYNSPTLTCDEGGSPIKIEELED